MKPADLKVGDRITCRVGVLVVDREPFKDFGDEPAFDQVEVDVQVEDPKRFGDPDGLPAATGAALFLWLGSTPLLRYRLYFQPDADVEVER